MAKKNTSSQEPPPLSVIRGQQVKAKYIEQLIPEHQNNPNIEALPPLWSMSEVEEMLSYFPSYNPEQRNWAQELRLHLLDNSREFFIPQGVHYEIHLSISNMIRRGYIDRNPIGWGVWAKQSEKLNQMDRKLHRKAILRSKARGFAIIGLGGVGKTTAVENILYHYPQVITHTRYKDQDLIFKQLVWVKLQCPSDGSLKALCLNYLQEVDDILGTNYMGFYGANRRTVDELLLIMARVASIHYLGVIVFDEIQDLSDAKSGGASRMLNFFVQMENILGIPFILIATPKVKHLFNTEFRQARRISEQADIYWRPMREIADKEKSNVPNQPDPEWNIFIRAMWKFWYLKKDHPLPNNLLEDPSIREIYMQSKGITALVVTIFFLAQRRAITSGIENLTTSIIRSAVKDNLNSVSEIFERLKEGQQANRKSRLITDIDSSEWQWPKSTPENQKPSRSSEKTSPKDCSIPHADVEVGYHAEQEGIPNTIEKESNDETNPRLKNPLQQAPINKPPKRPRSLSNKGRNSSEPNEIVDENDFRSLLLNVDDNASGEQPTTDNSVFGSTDEFS